MISKKEILLSINEIKEIEESARNNPQLKDLFLMNIASNYNEIVKVSPVHGLIFVKGNEHTGFDHIFKRHEQWTNSPNWQEIIDNDGKMKLKLQNQSLFCKDSTPFFDYCSIADSIYKKENLNIEKNSRLDIFDLYIGAHKHKDESIEKYRLLVYKGSKVVHTLFPQSNKNNPKRVTDFNFSRGVVSSTWDIMNSILEIKIPYLNRNRQVKYTLIIKTLMYLSIEKAFVQIFNEEEKPWKTIIIGERQVEIVTPFENPISRETMSWQYADLRSLEKIILEIENEKFPT